MLGRTPKPTTTATPTEHVLEVTAAMQGTLSFKDPVNLRINGRFEGVLETLGSLTIGERAQVVAQITGETIVIVGRVQGKVVARQSLRLVAPAFVNGEVWTPRLTVEDGARLDGGCHMSDADALGNQWLSEDEVAQYLEIGPTVVRQWAGQGRIPAVRQGEQWRFDKAQLDQWVASERGR